MLLLRRAMALLIAVLGVDCPHLADEQGKPELRELLRKKASLSYVERLSDFHLLLWLSKQPNLDSNDIILLCDAVKGQKPVLEGYRVIIDSIAGI